MQDPENHIAYISAVNQFDLCLHDTSIENAAIVFLTMLFHVNDPYTVYRENRPVSEKGWQSDQSFHSLRSCPPREQYLVTCTVD